jgi:hypothetical protein
MRPFPKITLIDANLINLKEKFFSMPMLFPEMANFLKCSSKIGEDVEGGSTDENLSGLFGIARTVRQGRVFAVDVREGDLVDEFTLYEPVPVSGKGLIRRMRCLFTSRSWYGEVE